MDHGRHVLRYNCKQKAVDVDDKMAECRRSAGGGRESSDGECYRASTTNNKRDPKKKKEARAAEKKVRQEISQSGRNFGRLQVAKSLLESRTRPAHPNIFARAPRVSSPSNVVSSFR